MSPKRNQTRRPVILPSEGPLPRRLLNLEWLQRRLYCGYYPYGKRAPTAGEVALALGISQQSLSQRIHGVVRFKESELVKLAEILEVKPTKFIAIFKLSKADYRPDGGPFTHILDDEVLAERLIRGDLCHWRQRQEVLLKQQQGQ